MDLPSECGWEADARASVTVDVPAPFVVAAQAAKVRDRAVKDEELARENFEIVQVHHEAEMKRKEAMQTKVDQLGQIVLRSLKARDQNESAGKLQECHDTISNLRSTIDKLQRTDSRVISGKVKNGLSHECRADTSVGNNKTTFENKFEVLCSI